MNYILAVFNNRTHTLQYSKILKQIGIPNSIITTPRDISHACGISVKFGYSYLSKSSLIINQFRLQSFKHFYLIKTINNSTKKYIPL